MTTTATFRLSDIAHGRSGDKGNHANVAVIAYTPAGFAWLNEHLTAEVVQRYFAAMKPSRVERFEAANVLGLNFVLRDLLAGGRRASRCALIRRVRRWPWQYCKCQSRNL